MDIISYSKGKKAKKQVAELNQRLGHTDKYKHGDKDIKDKYNSVDKRISEIEQTAAPGILNKKVSDLSTNTMINLNKHNLKVKSLLNATRYNHKNMIFDDFKDKNNIASSNNVYFDTTNGRIYRNNKSLPATLTLSWVSVPESANAIAISLSVKDLRTTSEKLQDGLIDFEADENGFYEQQKTFYSNAVLIKKESTLEGVDINFTGESIFETYYAVSDKEDGDFNSWESFNKREKIVAGSYVKVKFIVFNKVTNESYIYKNKVIEADMKEQRLGVGIRIDSEAAPHEISPLRIISDNDGPVISLNNIRQLPTVAVQKDELIDIDKVLKSHDPLMQMNYGETIMLRKTVHHYAPYTINPFKLMEFQYFKPTLHQLSIHKNIKGEQLVGLKMAIQKDGVQLNGTNTLTLRKSVK